MLMQRARAQLLMLIAALRGFDCDPLGDPCVDSAHYERMPSGELVQVYDNGCAGARACASRLGVALGADCPCTHDRRVQCVLDLARQYFEQQAAEHAAAGREADRIHAELSAHSSAEASYPFLFMPFFFDSVCVFAGLSFPLSLVLHPVGLAVGWALEKIREDSGQPIRPYEALDIRGERMLRARRREMSADALFDEVQLHLLWLIGIHTAFFFAGMATLAPGYVTDPESIENICELIMGTYVFVVWFMIPCNVLRRRLEQSHPAMASNPIHLAPAVLVAAVIACVADAESSLQRFARCAVALIPAYLGLCFAMARRRASREPRDAGSHATACEGQPLCDTGLTRRGHTDTSSTGPSGDSALHPLPATHS